MERVASWILLVVLGFIHISYVLEFFGLKIWFGVIAFPFFVVEFFSPFLKSGYAHWYFRAHQTFCFLFAVWLVLMVWTMQQTTICTPVYVFWEGCLSGVRILTLEEMEQANQLNEFYELCEQSGCFRYLVFPEVRAKMIAGTVKLGYYFYVRQKWEKFYLTHWSEERTKDAIRRVLKAKYREHYNFIVTAFFLSVNSFFHTCCLIFQDFTVFSVCFGFLVSLAYEIGDLIDSINFQQWWKLPGGRKIVIEIENSLKWKVHKQLLLKEMHQRAGKRKKLEQLQGVDQEEFEEEDDQKLIEE